MAVRQFSVARSLSRRLLPKFSANYKPTIFFGVPVVYRILLDEAKKHPGGSTLDCSSLRLCISAGEALPAQLGEEWGKTFGAPLLDGIGSTGDAAYVDV